MPYSNSYPSSNSAVEDARAEALARQDAELLLEKIKTVDGFGSGLDSDTVDGREASYLLSRDNHTGTQSSSTIDGLPAKVSAFKSIFDFMSDALRVKITGGTASAADATEISAAIDAGIAANPGGALYFPPGNYYVNKTFQQQANCCEIIGDGPNRAYFFQQTANIDTFKFGPPSSGSYLSGGPRLRGVLVSHASVIASSTTGAGVRFVQCSGYRIENSSINDTAEGLTIEGGQLGRIRDVGFFATSGSAKGAGSALLHFREADLGGSSYQPCYTVSATGLYLSASKLRKSCIRIASSDGLQFDNIYMGYGEDCLVTCEFDRDGAYIGAASFTNTYFDCVGAGNTPTAILIPSDAYTSSFIYGFNVGSGCILGNGDNYGFFCQKPQVMSVTFQDARFINFDKAAIVIDNASGDLLDFQSIGCEYQNCGSVSTSVINIANGRSLVLSGNNFADNVNVQVTISGTWRTGSITGNVNAQSTVADLSIGSATFTSSLVLAGNSSRRSQSANSWLGSTFGNVAVAEINRLDWYEEGAATPVLSFDGDSTGITYTRQLLKYTRVGDRVFYNGRITLSSKGSATGAVRIGAGAFPFASADANVSGYPGAVRFTNVTSGVGDSHIASDVVGGAAAGSVYMRIFKVTGGVGVGLQNSDLTDTSDFIFSGSYQVG